MSKSQNETGFLVKLPWIEVQVPLWIVVLLCLTLICSFALTLAIAVQWTELAKIIHG